MSTLRRRVDFNLAAGQTREERLARNHTIYNDSSDEDEEERRIQEEEEEERRLSAINGEAAEETSNSRKRKEGPQTDQEIEAEYSTTTKKRKLRVTLQATNVIGNEGLVKIRTEFPTILAKLGQRRKSIQAAAAYSRRLKNAYKQWAFQLFPGLGMEDVLSRVETFGSKREVKDYLQTMRDMARNDHLEKVYGRERAEKMLNELESGLQKQNVEEEMARDETFIPGEDLPMEEVTEEPKVTSPSAARSAAPAVTPAVDSDSEEELEFAPAAKPVAAQTNSAFLDTDDEDDDDANEETTRSIRNQNDKENMDPSSDVQDTSGNEFSSPPLNTPAASENGPESGEGAKDVDGVVPVVSNPTSGVASKSSALLDTDDEENDEQFEKQPGVEDKSMNNLVFDTTSSDIHETSNGKNSIAQVFTSEVSEDGEEAGEGEKEDDQLAKLTDQEETMDEKEETSKLHEEEELSSVTVRIDANEHVENQEARHKLHDSLQTNKTDLSMEIQIEQEKKTEFKEDDELDVLSQKSATPVTALGFDTQTTSLSSAKTFQKELEDNGEINVPNPNFEDESQEMTALTSTTTETENCNNDGQKEEERKLEDSYNISADLDSEIEPSQTQATVLASAAFDSTAIDSEKEASQTQATVLASAAFDSTAIDSDEEASQTQATVLASTAFDSTVIDSNKEASQTQATVLASAASEILYSETASSQTQGTVLDSAALDTDPSQN